MIELTGYKIIELVFRGKRSLVYRAYDNSRKERVIIKTAAPGYNFSENLLKLTNEFTIAGPLQIQGVLKYFNLLKLKNTHALLMEDSGGITLKDWINKYARGDEKNFVVKLKIALEISRILQNIHKHKIIHKNINPGNILLTPAGENIFIIDFGVALNINLVENMAPVKYFPPGAYSYTPPELTGRVSFRIDRRTDLYGLGMTFYELFTGRLPFTSDDPARILHFHIAQAPPPPEEFAKMPKTLSAIILRLLAKNPDERYQSIRGLIHDLELIWKDINHNNFHSNFKIGSGDIPPAPRLPEILRGRNREIAEIENEIKNIRGGDKRLIILGGPTGIGKSALMQEVRNNFPGESGYFITGKFEQFKKNISYGALVQALGDLVNQILMESPDRLQRWREKLLAGLGPGGGVMLDIVPELELITGPLPPLPPQEPALRKNRFNLAFQNLLKVFANSSHPLIIFFDDIHWSDRATLELIRFLISDGGTRRLLIVCAQRKNQGEENIALASLCRRLELEGNIPRIINLLPLGKSDIIEMLEESLKPTTRSLDELADLFLEKTGGNPYFLIQLLKGLINDERFYFDFEAGGRQWDQNLLESENITAGIESLMEISFNKLSKNAQNVLQLAATLGASFGLKELSAANQTRHDDTLAILNEAIVAGLILPQEGSYARSRFRPDAYAERENDGGITPNSSLLAETDSPHFKFSHDRVQQVAYSSVNEEEQEKRHLKIGRLLNDILSREQRKENISLIVYHLNKGARFMKSRAEIHKLSLLNYLTAKKMKETNAYGVARNLLENVRARLPHDCWNSRYELSIRLHRELAEIEFLTANYKELGAVARLIDIHSRNILDRAYVRGLLVSALASQGNIPGSVEMALQTLRELGFRLSASPGKIRLAINFIFTSLSLVRIRLKSPENNPKASDLYAKDAMNILAHALAPAYSIFSGLYPLIILKMVKLSVKYGNFSYSPFAYAVYGTLLDQLGYYNQGTFFGKLALNLQRRKGKLELKSKVLLTYSFFISHWTRPLSRSIQGLKKAWKSGFVSGDLEYLSYSYSLYLVLKLFHGHNLDDLAGESQECLELFNALKQNSTYDWTRSFYIIIQLLRGELENLDLPADGKFNSEEVLRSRSQTENKVMYFYLCFSLLLYYFHKSDFQTAEKYIHLMSNFKENRILGGAALPDFYFYYTLVLFALYPSASLLTRIRYRSRIVKNIKKMKKWSAFAPSNRKHKYLLLLAMKKRNAGKHIKAMEYFDQALNLALQHSFQGDAALIAEITGEYYLGRGQIRVGVTYITQACELYEKWGARYKKYTLEKKYAAYLNPEQPPQVSNQTGSNPRTLSSSRDATPDLEAIMKVYQAISGEILLDQLLGQIMEVVINNAGAQRGYLILERNGELFIEAQGAREDEEMAVYGSAPVEYREDLARGVVNYVARTREAVLLSEAGRDPRFQSDPYIKEKRPRSLLCIPVIKQNDFVGLLYLENNLIPNAFTPDRVEMLSLFATQAAISLENAELYENMSQEVEHRKHAEKKVMKLNEDLEKRVKERTAQLEETNQELESFSYSISHDLRAPLRSIGGFSQAVLEDYGEDLGEEGTRYLNLVVSNAHKMNVLIDDLLRFSRYGRQRMSLSEFDPGELAQEVYDDLMMGSGIKNLKFELQPMPAIKADRSLLRQVYQNLISNAIKYSQKEGEARVIIGAMELEDKTVYYVKDNGAGFDMKYQDKLFVVFQRLHTDKEFEGTGIGLSIVQRIIHRHGGNIWAESAPGEGATFYFTLPPRETL